MSTFIEKELYIRSTDYSTIQYQTKVSSLAFDSLYIRGQSLGVDNSLTPGEIFISSGTNNLRWVDPVTRNVYQAKGIYRGPTSTRVDNEIYLSVDSGIPAINIVRNQGIYKLSTNEIRNGGPEGALRTANLSALIMLDASGSMTTSFPESTTRIAAAKNVLRQFVSSIPIVSGNNFNLGFGYFGGTNTCNVSIPVPAVGFNKTQLDSAIRNSPSSGSTPIGGGLNSGRLELRNRSGNKMLIFIADTYEDPTCGSNIPSEAQKLSADGIDVKIVGIGLTQTQINKFKQSFAFVENASSETDLRRIINSLIDTSENRLVVYEDPARTIVATEVRELLPGRESQTRKHIDVAYCTLFGSGNDTINFTVPLNPEETLKSGYLYNVTYVYEIQEPPTYSCELRDFEEIYELYNNETVSMMIVLDNSGSMLETLTNGGSRISEAKNALSNIVDELPNDDGISLGFAYFSGCSATVTRNLAELDKESIKSAINSIPNAVGATGVASGLNAAIDQFEGVFGRKIIVLVADGFDNCAVGTMPSVAQRIRDEGIELRVVGMSLTSGDIGSYRPLGNFFVNSANKRDFDGYITDSILSELIYVFSKPTTSICTGTTGVSEALCSAYVTGYFWEKQKGNDSRLELISSSGCAAETDIGVKTLAIRSWTEDNSICLSSDPRGFISNPTCSSSGISLCVRGNPIYKVDICECSSVAWSASYIQNTCIPRTGSCSSCGDAGNYECFVDGVSVRRRDCVINGSSFNEVTPGTTTISSYIPETATCNINDIGRYRLLKTGATGDIRYVCTSSEYRCKGVYSTRTCLSEAIGSLDSSWSNLAVQEI
jgi:Mg-chelatase subunit ChlD